MDQPLISVIVPVYKVEPYLARCVESIQNQTYQNLEIILVDDGSPDRCGEICDEMAKEDARIRVVHKENGGLSSARNAGLDVMTGEYVGFVDSDDWIHPDMYQTLYSRMIAECAQISCCGVACHDDEKIISLFNPKKDQQLTLSTEAALRELMKNYLITNSVWDKLYRADIFKTLRMKNGVLYEDAQIQPYCIHQAQRICYTSQPMYYYYQSPQSILRGNFSTRHYDVVRASEERLAFIKEHYPQILPDAQAAHIIICIELIYKSNGISDWDAYRPKLIQTVQAPLDRSIIQKMPLKYRIKQWLLTISPKLFVTVMNLYTKKLK